MNPLAHSQEMSVDTIGQGVVGRSIRVRGVVQGVGFRPFVVTLGREYGVSGEVWNDAEGVKIHVWGGPEQIAGFITMLRQKAPPLAQVHTVEVLPLLMLCEHNGFKVIASRQGETHTGVVADAATCSACLDEISSPDNRRYRYPFTNCTHCGPRLSIIQAVPYDRRNTSMSSFQMCPSCRAEYGDQTDRRFHAQPNACPECGPEVWLEDASGDRMQIKDAVADAAAWIKSGRIVAIKGIGGFHLACDACNEKAVSRLRQRKKRYHKPFALMGRDLAQVRNYVALSGQEQALLESAEAPVVVMDAKPDCAIPPAVAPNQAALGFMLPYTPLHHLLMQELDGPIVLTSGNISEEPQCLGNSEARARLHTIVDGYLLHDRKIVNRLDDSVARVVAGKPRLLRRARGYAPASIRLPTGFEQAGAILAMGGELKNTFCMITQGQAVVSQHMGDLENAETLRDYRRNIDLYQRLYDFDAEAIAVDRHPDYFSTRLGREMAAEQGKSLVEVQHHHAHIASCMAEHGVESGEKVLGVALDGLGLGEDGAIWGGEFLLADYLDYTRIGTIQPISMIGGSKAIYEPWRNTYAHLYAIGWNETHQEFSNVEIIRKLAVKPLKILDGMIEKGLNAPQASSTGRLFDAVAAALGVCSDVVGFEGQAAMELETLAMQAFDLEEDNAYPASMHELNGLPTLGWNPMWKALLSDLDTEVSKERIAARFHHGLIRSVVMQAVALAERHHLQRIVLSGGVFQNRLLAEGVKGQLETQSFKVLLPELLPANDGGLALGQGVVAAARRLAGMAGAASGDEG